VQLEACLNALELNPTDADMLFTLLDSDVSGIVDIDEFCGGCLKLKGTATALDMNCLLFNIRRMANQIGCLTSGEAFCAKMTPHKSVTAETEGVHSERSTARSSSSIERVPLTAKELCTNRDAPLGGPREEAQILKEVMDESRMATTSYAIPLLSQQPDGPSGPSEIMSTEGVSLARGFATIVRSSPEARGRTYRS